MAPAASVSCATPGAPHISIGRARSHIMRATRARRSISHKIAKKIFYADFPPDQGHEGHMSLDFADAFNFMATDNCSYVLGHNR